MRAAATERSATTRNVMKGEVLERISFCCKNLKDVFVCVLKKIRHLLPESRNKFQKMIEFKLRRKKARGRKRQAVKVFTITHYFHFSLLKNNYFPFLTQIFD